VTVPEKSVPLEFLERAQSDPAISARILKAVLRGSMLTADEVLQIAQEFGYSFTCEEFEREVRRDMERRFKAGDDSLSDVVGTKKPPKPPESSCAKGCLSYTKSWHPTAELT